MKRISAKHLFPLLFCLLLSHLLSAQKVEWAYTLKGNYFGNFDLAAADEQNNIFVHGEYTGTVYHGSTGLPGAYPATYDQVLLQYRPGATPGWFKKNRGFKNGISTVGITDDEGNYYELSGYTNGVFDGTIHQPSGTTAYLTKYSPTGQRHWIKFMKGGFLYPGRLFLNKSRQLVFSVNLEGELWYDNQLVSAENGTARMLKVNAENGSIASGFSREPYVPFRMDKEGNLYEMGAHQGPLVRKRDPENRLLWQKNISSNPGSTFLRNLEVDLEGNTYLTGTYCGTISVDQLTLSADCNPQQAGTNVFLLKLDKNGKAEWLKGMGQYYMGGNLRVLPHPEGGIYLAGINGYNPSLLGTPLPPGLFISRLSAEGNMVWLRSFSANIQLYQLSLQPYPHGLLFSSAIPGASAEKEIDLDGHKVTKEAGLHTFFFAYLKEEAPCARIPEVKLPAAYCSGIPGDPVYAAGENIRWYADASRAVLLAEGNHYQPRLTATTTFYVTQTIGGCESRPGTAIVQVKANPAVPLAEGVTYCNGNKPVLTASGQNLRWYQDASLLILVASGNNAQLNLTGNATFYVTQRVADCESAAAEVKVRMNPAPPAPEVNNTFICNGTIQSPLMAQGSQITWYADAALTQKIGEGSHYSASSAVPSQVYVTQRINGCESVAARSDIKEGNNNFLQERLANIITPNGDDKNEAFTIPAFPEGSCIGNFKQIVVYNRWGSLVFQSKQPDFVWDAKGQTDGVYFYLLAFDNFTYKGNLTVNR